MARERTAKSEAAAEDKDAASKDSASKDRSEKVRKRILLVDDDQEIIDSLRYALEAKGYQILIARDGNQGLAMEEPSNRT